VTSNTNKAEGDRLPPPVLELNRHRRTAREIVEADASWKVKSLALITLSAEATDELGSWGTRCVYEEARAFLGDPRPAPTPSPDAFITKQRRLHSEGYRQCPRCGMNVLTEMDFEREAAVREMLG
jgi:hypothetical protein